MPRILYGVQGEGRGHATRSLRVLQALIREGHDVLVLSGGDALPVLSAALGNRVVEVPLLRYHYNARGALCLLRTAWRNVSSMLRLVFPDPALEGVIRRFRPEAAVSDFEPLSCRLARTLGIPLVAVDHQHFLTETRLPPVRGFVNACKLLAYLGGTRILSGWPRRVIVSSFHHFPKRRRSRAVFVGPFLPEDVFGIPAQAGSSVVAYLKRPEYLARVLPALSAFPDRTFEVFSAWGAAEWTAGLPRNVRLHPVSRGEFIRALASCHALIATAGNQVLGEAMHWGKPALVLPEPGVLEQEFNARALEESGCGAVCAFEDFTPEAWRAFEAKRENFLEGLREHKRSHPHYDGLEPALRVLRRLLRKAGRAGNALGTVQEQLSLSRARLAR